MDLPTYAFQRERYWVELARPDSGTSPDPKETADSGFWEAVERGDASGLADLLALPGDESLTAVLPALSAWRRQDRERSAVDSWRYRVAWSPLADAAAGVLSGVWLVVVPAGLAGDAWVGECVSGLARSGAEPVVLELGADRAGREEMAGRLREAASGADAVAGVVSLLALASGRDAAYPSVPVGLAATLCLVQALGDAGVEAPLWCVTRGAVAVTDSERVTGLDQAPVWGLGRVAATEGTERWGGLIDLPGVVDARLVGRLAGVLASPGGEGEVAVRAAGVFGRRVVRAVGSGGGSWRVSGTVLVTGGTGGVGRHVARWLARAGAEHVVLASRRGPAVDGVAELGAEVAGLGSRLSVVACDVGDRDA
ncbi:SDR family NAD(P)-dependent oxidoreductase, partial [Streptomyces sp. NPDC042638]|uniref:SDR family NAD(P)-dependent oxidoreductase n=1 Tax=Streptomyces sp. NPDC042638 TaxID=3154333 RepID=UPI0033C013D3